MKFPCRNSNGKLEYTYIYISINKSHKRCHSMQKCVKHRIRISLAWVKVGLCSCVQRHAMLNARYVCVFTERGPTFFNRSSQGLTLHATSGRALKQNLDSACMRVQALVSSMIWYISTPTRHAALYMALCGTVCLPSLCYMFAPASNPQPHAKLSPEPFLVDPFSSCMAM